MENEILEEGNQLNATLGLGWVDLGSTKYWHLDLYFENGEMKSVSVTELEAKALMRAGLDPFNG